MVVLADGMETTSPYQSPETQAGMNPLPVGQRSTIPKVFGIINIVLAILGSIGALFGLVSVFGMRALADMADDASLTKMAEAIDVYKPYILADLVVKIGLGVLLILGGVKLLKYKLQGAKLTKVWALIRIGWALVFPLVSYSAMMEYQKAIASIQADGGEAMMAMQGGVITIIQMVIGIAMVCVYPILSILFLRKEDVQKSLS